LRALFPIYLALAKRLIQIPPDRTGARFPTKPIQFSSIVSFLGELMDLRVMVHQLRQLLQTTTLNSCESGLRALILRHLRKPTSSIATRSISCWCNILHSARKQRFITRIDLADTAQVMQPVLGEIDTTPLAWCEPLEKMIEALRTFRSVREILKTNFIEQGRRVKESAGGMFYDPSALVAFIRFNFLLRRTLIELMHADLIAIRAGLAQLESGGIRFLDCQRAGLSANESISRIKQAAEDWKQPFQKEYTERTVSQAFEKLLGLRSDVEQVLEKLASRQTLSQALNVATTQAIKSLPPGKLPALDPAKPSAKIELPANLDFETCMEQIWEQLIATPPSPGRSMTTIRLGAARVLLSSWEVSAFVSEDGPSAEDLRRAVVARALVSAATESTRETGNATSLDRALAVARTEVTRLLERVDAAKHAKDTEAAVNMGISAKRLNSAIDEAEKL
jgi:hypothetical protein